MLTFGHDQADYYLQKPVIQQVNNGNTKPILKCPAEGEFIVVFDGFTSDDGREQNTHTHYQHLQSPGKLRHAGFES